MRVEAVSQMPSEYRDGVRELLWQLADDDLVIAFRASEWLGLAPHVEEDVAFSSIAQDEMGHAAMYYELLEQIGEGHRDEISHLRPAASRRNTVLAEVPNGSGSYLHQPHFDWALTVVRHYFYDVSESLRLAKLSRGSYGPLADVAEKALREEAYHLAHQKLWMTKMARHNEESRERLRAALVYACSLAGDLTDLGLCQDACLKWDIFPQAETLADCWRDQVGQFVDGLGYAMPTIATKLNGRRGEHSEALADLLATLSEVYRSEPGATW